MRDVLLYHLQKEFIGPMGKRCVLLIQISQYDLEVQDAGTLRNLSRFAWWLINLISWFQWDWLAVSGLPWPRDGCIVSLPISYSFLHTSRVQYFLQSRNWLCHSNHQSLDWEESTICTSIVCKWQIVFIKNRENKQQKYVLLPFSVTVLVTRVLWKEGIVD